jgi:hypothetical protein
MNFLYNSITGEPKILLMFAVCLMVQDRLFFIYVSKNDEWKKRYEQDWDYVSSMSRFFKWWIKHEFHEDLSVEADILPVVPGKLFDRINTAYLLRDHKERGFSVFHFYLTYFKPLWTDCHLEGYHGDNFGLTTWFRPKVFSSDFRNERYFADNNCAKISHVICHELLRRKQKKRKVFFDQVHKIWDLHVNDNVPFFYYNKQFNRVSKNSEYKYVTMDTSKLEY